MTQSARARRFGRQGVKEALRTHYRLERERRVSLTKLYEALERYDDASGSWSFRPGDVVEVEGEDGRWRLATVTVATPERSGETSYSVVSAAGFSHGYGRERPLPRAAACVTKAVFGESFLIWRAFAMVKLEEEIRIQEGHVDDFEGFDYVGWGERHLDRWLHDRRNWRFFSRYEAASSGARESLRRLCLEPFSRMEAVKARATQGCFNSTST